MPNELTNPNNVVTEERLAQFYQQILPYLGGMPDILANKFSKADLYSTDEKMIGRWIDGKPLYQKTVHKVGLPINTYMEACNTPENMDTLVRIDHCFYFSDGAAVSDNFYAGDRDQYRVWYYDGTIRVGCYTSRSAAIMSASTIDITLQYTKTTDSAVDIGSDTDYSTTEKIVGTWIDGKPIWQKTVDCGTVTADGSWHEVQHSISNIDQVVHADGALFGNNGNVVSVCSVVSSFNFTAYAEADRTKVNYVVGSSRSSGNYKLYVTLRYTKTSS